MEDSITALILRYSEPEIQMKDSNIAPIDNIEGICLPQKRERCSLKHPGFVGDGNIKMKCKICNRWVDINTLICDKCEEAFHITCLKQKVKPKDIDDWYCQPCEQYIKKYEYHFSANVPAEHKAVRMGSTYQTEVPEYTSQPPPDSSEKRVYEGFTLPEDGWKETNWQPAESLPENEEQNWLQCKRILYMKGDICPDGQIAKRDIRCGKWRRAPMRKRQKDKWDCESAVLWNPARADCREPQELETSEIERRMKASRHARAQKRARSLFDI